MNLVILRVLNHVRKRDKLLILCQKAPDRLKRKLLNVSNMEIAIVIAAVIIIVLLSYNQARHKMDGRQRRANQFRRENQIRKDFKAKSKKHKANSGLPLVIMCRMRSTLRLSNTGTSH